VIISDIVWADLISWLHVRGVYIRKTRDVYEVYMPARDTTWPVPVVATGSWQGFATLPEALSFAMSVDVGAK
jgi:hypothetical protein